MISNNNIIIIFLLLSKVLFQTYWRTAIRWSWSKNLLGQAVVWNTAAVWAWTVVPWHGHMERCLATDFIQVQALHWTYLILLVYKKLFFELSSCHETSDEILFGFELKNPTIYNIICWFAGTNDSSTKRLMFQVLSFFMISCKILCKNPFNLFSYFFIKLQKYWVP